MELKRFQWIVIVAPVLVDAGRYNDGIVRHGVALVYSVQCVNGKVVLLEEQP